MARTASAPEALRLRAAEWLDQAPPGPDPAARLAHAGDRALAGSLGRGEGRAAALDLLAADALVTLALLARAETAPGALADFATALVTRAARP
jgi:hypothetical protein